MADPRVAALIKSLRDQELLSPAQLEELEKSPLAQGDDLQALARDLFQRGWLTRYQINQAANGRARELRVGAYVLLDRLGEGGMGQVFKACHQPMNRTVALKLIRKEKLASSESVQRFLQEVRAAAQLVHPHIVVAYDAGQANGTHFFAMEYVDGVDLSRLVKESGPLSVARACDYVRQAALGLQHAHERGLVHRDVKPANLLLSKDGAGTGQVKILDMGLARLQGGGEKDKGLTQSGQVVGTPDYLAPEQALDARAADIRADLYSLGCTLFYLLTGRSPFVAETLTEVLLKHQMEEPTPVNRLRPEVPPALAAVVRKLMAKKPEERYQTPAEVAAALEPFARNGSGGLPALPVEVVPVESHEPAWGALVEDDSTPPPVRRPARGGSVTSVEEEDRPRPARKRKVREDDRRSLLLALGIGVGVLVLGLVTVMVILAQGRGKAKTEISQADPQSRLVEEPGPEVKPGSKENDVPVRTEPVERPSPPQPPEPKPRPAPEPEPPAPPPPAKGSSPLDQLDPSRVAAGDRPAGMPEVVAVLKAHSNEVWGVALSADEKTLASAGKDGTVRLWELGGPEPILKRTIEGKGGPINPMALAPNGKLLAFCSANILQLWDLSANPLLRAEMPGFGWLAFSGDSKTLAVASGNTVRLLDLTPRQPQERMQIQASPNNGIRSLALSRDGRTLALGGNDGSVALWDLSGKEPRERPSLKGTGQLLAVALSPNGKLVAGSGTDGWVRLWDPSGGQVRERFANQGHIDWANSISFAPDGQSFLTTGAGMMSGIRRVAVWWNTDGSKRKEWVLPERSAAGAFAPDGHHLALACHDKKVYVLRLASTTPVAMRDPARPEPEPEPEDKKLPVPSSAEQARVEKEVKETFKAEYAKKKPAERQALAQKLLEEAGQTRDRQVERYVLLSLARDLAVEAGDPDLISQVIDEMARDYVVNALEAKKKALEAALKTVSGSVAYRSLVEILAGLVDESVLADDYEGALKLAALAESASRKADNASLLSRIQARAKEVREVQAEFDKAKTALEKLKTKPDDPEANLAVGRFLAFFKGDWDKGLPHLSRGSDKDLAELAKTDVDQPVEAGEQAKLADGWADLGDKARGAARTQLLRRAHHWYAQSLAGLDGLAKTKVEKRVQALVKEMPDLMGPYDQLETATNAKIVNGFLRIERFKRVPTKESYAGPLEITVVARTQKNNIRLYAHQGGMLIFNWEGKVGSMRVHRPDSPRGAGTGTFVRELNLPLEPNVWHTLRWRIFPRGMDLVVDNKPAVPLVLDGGRLYDLRMAQQVEIGAWDSIVEVKSFRVRPIK